MKKDFSGIKTGKVTTVSQAIDQATGKKGQQTEATAEEQAARIAAMQTQGRKGCKLTRINMGFTDTNYDFLTIVSRATGHTLTQTCNAILKAYQDDHPELMEQTRQFVETVSGGALKSLFTDD